MSAARRVCRSRGVVLIEDCAQSVGARRNGKLAGAFGDLATFSFYPTKNLGAAGDGGAVVTNDEELAERVRRLRQYGWAERYRSVLAGGRNSRLDELQAAILRVKLPHVDCWNVRRREIVSEYRAAAGRRMRFVGSPTRISSLTCASSWPRIGRSSRGYLQQRGSRRRSTTRLRITNSRCSQAHRKRT